MEQFLSLRSAKPPCYAALPKLLYEEQIRFKPRADWLELNSKSYLCECSLDTCFRLLRWNRKTNGELAFDARSSDSLLDDGLLEHSFRGNYLVPLG